MYTLLFYRTHNKFPYKSLYLAFEESYCAHGLPTTVIIRFKNSSPGILSLKEYKILISRILHEIGHRIATFFSLLSNAVK